MLITVEDKTPGYKTENLVELKFDTEVITVEELIMRRVMTEVEAYNKNKTERFAGLVQPGESEKLLNGYKMKKLMEIDAEKQCYLALSAFQKNGYFLFIDDRQVDSLKEEIRLRPDISVTFIKLMPLVGG